MNIANKLTLARVFMLPLFVLAIEAGVREWFYGFDLQMARYVAVGIFIVAAITDFLDGFLARKLNLITDFGKFMDPLADKILVGTALIYMLVLGDLSAWFVALIFAREFIISGLRMLAASKNMVISAGALGKLKTVAQMVMIIVVLPNIGHDVFSIAGRMLIVSSALLTVVSMVDYIWANRQVFLGES